MLYVTTRDKYNAQTPYHPLCKERGSDGGFFIPMRDIRFSPQQISAFKTKSSGQCIAEILNLFFRTKLNGWDVDFCIGRSPFRMVPMSHRIIIAENWNNPQWDFEWTVRKLRGLVLGKYDIDGSPSDWTWIAVRIALLFGIFSELMRGGLSDSGGTVDIAVCAGDFSGPMAVWYARKMGLPIGTIVYGCNENSNAWDLLHHGELHTKATVIHTGLPLCDKAVPQDLERLIHATLGTDEALRLVHTLDRKGMYTLTEEQRSSISRGMHGAVVGANRLNTLIRNVYHTRSYLLGPYSALAYGALQDYRATKNESAPALILTEQGPMCARQSVAKALGINEEQLRRFEPEKE